MIVRGVKSNLLNLSALGRKDDIIVGFPTFEAHEWIRLSRGFAERLKEIGTWIDLLLSLVNWEIVAAQNWRQKSWKKKKRQFIAENILNIFGFENNTLRLTFFWFFSTCDVINFTKGENITSRHNFVLEWAGSSVSCRDRRKSDCFVVFLFHIWDLEKPIFDHVIINSWAMRWVTTIEKRLRLSRNSWSKYFVTYSESFVFMFIIVCIMNYYI